MLAGSTWLSRRAGFAVISGVCACAFLAGSGRAEAQARATAGRSIGLSAFGGVSGANPEVDGGPNDYGYVLGGDLTRSLRRVTPSVEVRYTSVTGSDVNEKTFLGGVKLERELANRLHPYVTVLFGNGNIDFNHPVLFNGVPYAHDNSFVYDFGGGVDVDLTRHLGIKGDVQYSHWHTGGETNAFTPIVVSVAAVYRFGAGKLSIRQ